MTEWVLPAEQLAEYERVRHELEHDPRWPRIVAVRARRLLAELQSEVSRSQRDVLAHDDGQPPRCKRPIDGGSDRRAGRAGPHASCIAASAIAATGTARSAASICRTCATPSIAQLIAADNLLDRAAERTEPWVEADGRRLQSRRPAGSASGQRQAGGLIAPCRGGQLYELDVRSICHNLLATLTRRPEAYHRKVLAGADGRNDVAGRFTTA